MTPMAFVMNLMKDGESYTIVIPAAEYFQIGKDPSIIAKYWDLLSKERGKNKEKLTSPGSAENQHSSANGHQHNQELPSDKKDKSFWDTKTAGHLISLCHKHGVNIDNPELNSALWNKISSEMNEQFPMSNISSEHCCLAFKKFVSAYKTIKSDPEKTGLKGELFAAVDRLAHVGTNCQTSVLPKGNDILKSSEAELNLKNKTCDSKDPVVSSENHTKVSEKRPKSSKKLKVLTVLPKDDAVLERSTVLPKDAAMLERSTALPKDAAMLESSKAELSLINKTCDSKGPMVSPENHTKVSGQRPKSSKKLKVVTVLPKDDTVLERSTVFPKDASMLERSKAELSVINKTCNLKGPMVSSENRTKVSGQRPKSSKKLKVVNNLRTCVASKSHLHSTASQAVFNSAESVLSKRSKKRNIVQPPEKNFKRRESSVSSSPLNSKKMLMPPTQVKPIEKDIPGTASQNNETCKSMSESISQGNKPCKIRRICSCQNKLPPEWFFKFEKQFECRWEHLAKMAQDQISAINELVSVLKEWISFEHNLQLPRG